jgi:group I intron endonuclease
VKKYKYYHKNKMEVFFMIVYKATNKINGKSYIGQTKLGLIKRRKQHLHYSKRKIVRTLFGLSLAKYGINNFEWKIVERCNNQEELNLSEEWYIRYYNTFRPNGYNMTYGSIGGDCGNQFTKLSKEERKKIHYMNNMTEKEKEEFLNKYRRKENHYTKRCMNEEEFEKWKTKRTGKNNPMYGKKRKHTEETKKKMSESTKGTIKDDSTKKKIGNANRGSKNGMARTYKITKKDGSFEVIKGLMEYCRINNTYPGKLRKEFKVEEIKGGDYYSFV